MSDDNLPKVENEDAFQSLLELAANDDLEAFRTYIDRQPLIVNDVGLWYGRQNGPARMALHHLTPLMVASTYGSLDVVKLILSRPEIDVNKSSGADKSTALHCAAAGGSIHTVEIVRELLSAGADPNLTDVNGRKPIDVIFIPPKPWGPQVHYSSLRSMLATEEYIPLSEKEYSVDALSMPDIKNGIYSTDEFRMFSFKIRPCSRAYSHDWTECPFVHPGENARRRDPRKFHYSCVACPDFRKGACRRGDMCEYAHGVFECWLHPAQYRTRLCKDGTSCSRRVCFFAHKQEELRPLYVSTGSGVPSPRSIAASPSPFTPPMSPSNQNVPTLHLPGSSNLLLSSSRLRSSLNARIFADNVMNANLPNRPLRPITLMTPSNLEDMFSSDVYSPRHIQHQQQGMLSPINATFSSGRMSPRHHHMDSISPMLARSKWGPPVGAVAPDELGELESCSSFEVLNNAEEPDLSWVHSLVRESSHDVKKEISGHGFAGNEGENSNNEIDQSVLGAWLEQMQLDQLIAQ